jgi:hypothetical protein
MSVLVRQSALLSTPVFTRGANIVVWAGHQRTKGRVNQYHDDKAKDGNENELHWVIARSRPKKTCYPRVLVGITSKSDRRPRRNAPPVLATTILGGPWTHTVTSVISQSKFGACPTGRYEKQCDINGNVVALTYPKKVVGVRAEILQPSDLHIGKLCKGGAINLMEVADL